jgi:catechol-2,3-dioxygenase
MATNSVSAVLFAKNLGRVAAFYREVFGASVLRGDPNHELLTGRLRGLLAMATSSWGTIPKAM